MFSYAASTGALATYHILGLHQLKNSRATLGKYALEIIGRFSKPFTHIGKEVCTYLFVNGFGYGYGLWNRITLTEIYGHKTLFVLTLIMTGGKSLRIMTGGGTNFFNIKIM